MARPRKVVDEDRVAELAYYGSNNVEIAQIVGIDEAQIRRRFAELVRKKRAERRADLRKLQWQEAASGNAALLIWLGKNELQQADKVDPPVTKVVVTYADRGIEDYPDPPALGSGDDPA